MANPTPYERTYSFTDYQASNPSAPLPGIQVDNELENIENSLGGAIDAIKDVRRSDGALKNGIVTVDSLDPTVAAGVGAGALASAAAAAASADDAEESKDLASGFATAAEGYATAASGYASNALTSRNEAETERTLAQTARTGAQTARDFSNKWATEAEGVLVDDGVNDPDYSAYHYAQVALGAATGALSDNSVSTSKIVDANVTTAKLADGAVTSAKIADETIATGDIADGAITSAKIADETIATGDISDGAVTSAKIADGAVTNAKMADGLAKAIDALTGVNGRFIRLTGAATAAVQSIVGTVSQSGGTPTGAIIEKGSNANGEYVRYADGTQICWGTSTASIAVTTASGSSFVSSQRTQTFPAAFVAGSIPVFTSSQSIGSITSVVTSPTDATFFYTHTASGTLSRTLVWQAVGRWF